jgi:hypothetical protein
MLFGKGADIYIMAFGEQARLRVKPDYPANRASRKPVFRCGPAPLKFNSDSYSK